MESIPSLLELALVPDDMATLLRQPALKQGRRTGQRATRTGGVWHDTPDGNLAAKGWSLLEYTIGPRTVWRLERMVADLDSLWPPGAIPRLIAESEALPTDLPTPLLPIAAIDGQQRVFIVEDGRVQVTVLQGELRAVAAALPFCRVRFEGIGADALALEWSSRIRLAVPPNGLAAEAFALARRDVPARPLGAPLLSATQTVEAGFAFIVAHLAGVIQHHAPSALQSHGPGWGPEPVHQMRVALRRLRSAILLFRRAVGCPALDETTLRLKDLGRVLGPPRDWDVFTAGTGRDIGASFPEDRAVTALLTAAERRRIAGYTALKHYLESSAWRGLGIALASLATTSPWRDQQPVDPEQAARQSALQIAPLRDFAARALKRRLQAVIAPGADLSGLPIEALHDIRLHLKRLRYTAEFFSPLFPGKQTRRFLRRMSSLQEHLGVMNDGAVAATLMAELPSRGTAQQHASGVIRGFVAARSSDSRRNIEASWHGFLKQDPFWV